MNTPPSWVVIAALGATPALGCSAPQALASAQPQSTPLLSSCSQEPDATASSGVPATIATVSASADATYESSPEVAVQRFDCGKRDELVTDVCVPDGGGANVSEEATGLRAFALGGAFGSAFNAQFLECAVELRTPCEGPASLLLLVGTQVVKQLPLPAKSAVTRCRLGLTAATWEAHLDKSRDAPFDTAVFHLEVEQQCGEPLYPAFARDVFVGGFSSGE